MMLKHPWICSVNWCDETTCLFFLRKKKKSYVVYSWAPQALGTAEGRWQQPTRRGEQRNKKVMQVHEKQKIPLLPPGGCDGLKMSGSHGGGYFQTITEVHEERTPQTKCAKWYTEVMTSISATCSQQFPQSVLRGVQPKLCGLCLWSLSLTHGPQLASEGNRGKTDEGGSFFMDRAQPWFLLQPGGTQYVCLAVIRLEAAAGSVSQASSARIVLLGRKEFKSNCSLIDQVVLLPCAFRHARPLQFLCLCSFSLDLSSRTEQLVGRIGGSFPCKVPSLFLEVFCDWVQTSMAAETAGVLNCAVDVHIRRVLY